jgi:hypothetical protein
MSTPLLFPANGNEAVNKVEWLQDVASLIEPEARERFLLRLATFQQVNPRDPLFATLDAMGLLTLAFQKVPGQIAKSVAESRAISQHVTTSVAASKVAAAEVQQLVEQAHATLQQLKHEIQRQGEITIETTRQALEDMRQEVSANLSSENVVQAYEEATRKRFAEVIERTVQPAITKSTTLITNRLENWAEGVLDQQLTKMSGAVNATLTSVTRDFRVRLYGAWSGLLWAMLSGGVIAALILFMAGYYLGEH